MEPVTTLYVSNFSCKRILYYTISSKQQMGVNCVALLHHDCVICYIVNNLLKYLLKSSTQNSMEKRVKGTRLGNTYTINTQQGGRSSIIFISSGKWKMQEIGKSLQSWTKFMMIYLR